MTVKLEFPVWKEISKSFDLIENYLKYFVVSSSIFEVSHKECHFFLVLDLEQEEVTLREPPDKFSCNSFLNDVIMICERELYRILVSNKFVVRTSSLFSYGYNKPKKLRQWVWNSYLA